MLCNVRSHKGDKIRIIVSALKFVRTQIFGLIPKTGNESDMAARAVVESCPPYQVSTTLNMVLKKNPVPAGIASRRTSWGIGAVVKSEVILTG